MFTPIQVAYYSKAAAASGGTRRLKVWNGSAWTASTTKVWNGSAWTTSNPKAWNGSAWA